MAWSSKYEAANVKEAEVVILRNSSAVHELMAHCRVNDRTSKMRVGHS